MSDTLLYWPELNSYDQSVNTFFDGSLQLVVYLSGRATSPFTWCVDGAFNPKYGSETTTPDVSFYDTFEDAAKAAETWFLDQISKILRG